MADKELEGASLPTGIEVDDAAAYFGVIESSDMVHTLMDMEQEKAMEQFFSILSDVVLLPGDFDFEAASERIQCEGGEIYYLVAGHLGLMSLPDPLSQYLGLPDSSGESSGQSPSLSEEEQSKLATLADPMRILKLLAVASTTGSEGEVTRYLNTLKQLFADPASHTATLLAVADELNASLDVAGHALPVPSLASGKAAAAPIASVPRSVPTPAVKTPLPAEEVPLPPTPKVEKEVSLPDLPSPSEVSGTVELPSVEPVAAVEPILDTNNERMVARAEENAFSGAFDLGLGKEEPPVLPEPTPEPEQMEEPIPESVPEIVPEPIPEPEPVEEEEFVSAAEHFLAADTDGSKELSVEELAVATGTSLEEAKELHEQADTDGDGTVSLSEFISSPAAEKTQSLPRPVAPVRKPLAQQQQPVQQQPVQQQPAQQQQPQQGWNQQQQPQQGWNQQPQQQQGWNQQPQQQQGWNQQQNRQQGWNQPQQPIQPTIRSGVLCRGCGIGLDPYWRFCPICGTQSGGVR